ncbi:NAD-dependent epimerase/dehydratase family protein [Bacteroides cellulosilyticus]|jgi:UDP-N-acetylglucosamine 4-epimerase|uniref:NAD-dependent epimerase/dehydratase family protein n=1 Tax=Bacteroides cellulosilyticus TaxID=246787 RepID=UPI001D0708F1|nr:SDR family oxidoreductase [Bacteroides cellulosilyticus]MCB6595530.1 SDR family oxidoreductase [Bacteroides cellulosilyticus]
MRVAITGAGGFIGSKVLKKLMDYEGIDILALSRERYDGVPLNKVRWGRTDYSVNSLSGILGNVDVIIHLAATRGTQGLISDYHVNEIITENILLVMNKLNIKHIVFASSIAVYSDITKIPWQENICLQPKTLYGISKASCEYLCIFYAHKFKFRYTILRIAQVLGIEERRKGMMNNFIESACLNKQLIVNGKSVAKRQFIYVDDLAKTFVLCAIRQYKESIILNVGMQEAYTNLSIAKTVNLVFENSNSVDYKDNIDESIDSSFMDTHQYISVLGLKPKTMKEALYELKKQID